MVPFTFLLFLVINVFANAFFIWNRERKEVEDSATRIYPKAVDDNDGVFNSLVFAYRIGLGDFDFDGFEGSYNKTLFVAWFLGTFII